MKGKIMDIRPVICHGQLKVALRVKTVFSEPVCEKIPLAGLEDVKTLAAGRQDGCIDAFLPEREAAALIPCCILLGSKQIAPRSLLKTILPLLNRLCIGRFVNIVDKDGQRYAFFRSWRHVIFADD